jgi:hypothetical protein
MKSAYEIAKEWIASAETEQELLEIVQKIPHMLRQGISPKLEIVGGQDKEKSPRKRRVSKLAGWPKKALEGMNGRALPMQTVSFIRDAGEGYRLPANDSDACKEIDRFYNKNLNRLYQKFDDGSWGLIGWKKPA